MSKNQFVFTTTELARYAEIERATIYQSVANHGTWRGLRPRKMQNGRLLWPRDEVNRVLGIVPTGQAMSHEARLVVPLLDHYKIPLTPDAWAVVRALTRGRCDPDLDPGIEASANVIPLGLIMSTGVNRIGTSLTKCDKIILREVIEHMDYFLDEVNAAVKDWRDQLEEQS